MVFDSLLHLITFLRKAHESPPPSRLFITPRMTERLCAFLCILMRVFYLPRKVISPFPSKHALGLIPKPGPSLFFLYKQDSPSLSWCKSKPTAMPS